MNGSLADARRFLELLTRPGEVYELRGLTKHPRPVVTSGYFDDMPALAAAALARSGRDEGVYVTINPVNPALLARAPKNKTREAGQGGTTSDRDVRSRRHILVDIDAVRPAGISSTDDEHAAAIAVATKMLAELSAMGWPAPILGDSGNGAHLIYEIDLPLDDGQLVARVLAEMSRRYSSPTMKVDDLNQVGRAPVLKIDEKMFNPARISKIYGTLARKGENTPERPHRVSRIISAPDALDPVSRDLLERFAPAKQAAQPVGNGISPPGSAVRSNLAGGYQKFSIDEWIARHLPDAIEQPWTEGRKWLLQVCPFNSDHARREAFIAEKHGGMLSAGCMHESCFRSWRELRLHFEPDAYERSSDHATNGNAPRVSDRSPPPEVLYEDANYQAELDAFADRDREPTPAPTPAPAAQPKPKWHRAPDLVDEILRFANEPWVELRVGGDEIVRARPGGIVVVMGGSGSGKSSLVSGVLVEHAMHVGPAIALSIELPADEMAGRIVGMRCDASWEEALRGQVRREFMVDALALPRLFIIDRRNATLAELARCIDAARAEFPGQPILVAIDYAQLITSTERETRQKVADAIERIDDVVREKRVVAIAVSQMSRSAAKQARDGEKIGADSADGGAESAAIERFATATLSIGQAGETREDGSKHVELSLGKGRMSGGDRVIPMSYWGRTGRWRVAGEAKVAAEVRAERQGEQDVKRQQTMELALSAAAARATEPQTREQLMETISGRREMKRSAIACLIARGDLVEVQRRKPRQSTWLIWTPEHAAANAVPLVRDMEDDR